MNTTPNKIWQHRISHEAEISYPLLEQGYLSIGFSDLVIPGFVKKLKTEENAWRYFEDQIKEAWGHRPRTRHNLWRFLVDMEPGDWVIVPMRGTFSVYRIESEAIPVDHLDLPNLENWHHEPVKCGGFLNVDKEKGRAYDIGFLHRVSIVEEGISRRDYADAALTSRMKYRATNINCTSLRDSLDHALKAFRTGKPINLHSMILDASLDETRKLIQEQLNPDKFEELIQWYFQSLGASDVYIPAKNERDKEGDGDIIATFESLRTIYYIQAKHHTRVTGDWATQQISAYTDKKKKDAGDDGYNRISWVISTADSFSDSAVKLAQEESILLINGSELATLLLEAGISGLDQVF